MAQNEIAHGILKYGSSNSQIVGVKSFSLSEEFGSNEVRNNQTAGFAHLLQGQDDWTASIEIDLYTDSAGTSLESTIVNLRTNARNHTIAEIILQFGEASGAYTEWSKCKIESLDTEATMDRSGVWTISASVRGVQAWAQGTPS